MGNVHFFKFSLESGKLTFSLLVKFNLGGSVGTCLLKPRAQIFNVLLENCTALLSLSTIGALNGQFLIQFLQATLKFFDLLVVLASKSSFIFNLGSKSS